MIDQMDGPPLKHMSFVAACREFFGQKHGQTLQEFAGEIRALTQKDREELIALFRTVGYDATKVS